MRSIILISPSRNEISCLYEQWMDKAQNSDPSFYSISYSDKRVIEKFMWQSIFNRGSYIDNDLGRIIRIDELREGVSKREALVRNW